MQVVGEELRLSVCSYRSPSCLARCRLNILTSPSISQFLLGLKLGIPLSQQDVEWYPLKLCSKTASPAPIIARVT